MSSTLGLKPAVVFPNPEAAALAYLRTAIAARTETYKPAAERISKSFPPSALATADPGQTALQVQLELGNADLYPVTELAQVRFTAHGDPDHRSNVLALASIAQALVYTMATTDVLGTRIMVGRSDVSTDPDTGNLMVWFLAELKLKATRLTEPS